MDDSSPAKRRFASDSPPPSKKVKPDEGQSGAIPRSMSSSRRLVERQKPMVFVLNSVDSSLSDIVCADWAIVEGSIKVATFNDGEVNVVVKDSVRHRHCYVVQSTCHTPTQSVNDSLMALMLTIDALKRAAAKSVTAVIPYFGYARQDRKTRSRVPISASMVAKLIQSAGATRVISVDLHCGQIQGFFDIPVDNLYASVAFVPVLAQFLKSKQANKITIVSPDAGGVERCMDFLKGLSFFDISCGLAMCIKQRTAPGEVGKMDLVGAGEVVDADCVIVDDIADTCGTLVLCVKELVAAGARRVWACVTHPVFSKDALAKLEACSELQQLFVCNTLPVAWQSSKVTVISAGSIVATAIRRTITGKSTSEAGLFDFARAPALPPLPTTPGVGELEPAALLLQTSEFTSLSEKI